MLKLIGLITVIYLLFHFKIIQLAVDLFVLLVAYLVAF
jgi:hypothetical protein